MFNAGEAKANETREEGDKEMTGYCRNSFVQCIERQTFRMGIEGCKERMFGLGVAIGFAPKMRFLSPNSQVNRRSHNVLIADTDVSHILGKDRLER